MSDTVELRIKPIKWTSGKAPDGVPAHTAVFDGRTHTIREEGGLFVHYVDGVLRKCSKVLSTLLHDVEKRHRGEVVSCISRWCETVPKGKRLFVEGTMELEDEE